MMSFHHPTAKNISNKVKEIHWLALLCLVEMTVSSDIKKDLAKQNLFQASAIRLSKRFADVSRTQSRKSAQYNLVKMHIHVRTKK